MKDTRASISLFSGAMGLDLGLLQAGADIKLGQDFNAACVHTMEQNGHKAILGDIRAIEPEQLLSAAGLTFGEPFLICGGPPCQPFPPLASALVSTTLAEVFSVNMSA